MKEHLKTIKISPELHDILKKYCSENGLKLNFWIEIQLRSIYEKINNKNVSK